MKLALPIHCAHTRVVPVKEIRDHPLNPNIHTGEQIKVLAELIRLYGWRVPITISKRSGLCTAGHGRKLAAIRLKESMVPVDEQDYESEEAELADLIADNFLASLSSFDRGAVMALVEKHRVVLPEPEKFGIAQKLWERWRKPWRAGIEEVSLIPEYDPESETLCYRIPGIPLEKAKELESAVRTALTNIHCKITCK